MEEIIYYELYNKFSGTILSCKDKNEFITKTINWLFSYCRNSSCVDQWYIMCEFKENFLDHITNTVNETIEKLKLHSSVQLDNINFQLSHSVFINIKHLSKTEEIEYIKRLIEIEYIEKLDEIEKLEQIDQIEYNSFPNNVKYERTSDLPEWYLDRLCIFFYEEDVLKQYVNNLKEKGLFDRYSIDDYLLQKHILTYPIFNTLEEKINFVKPRMNFYDDIDKTKLTCIKTKNYVDLYPLGFGSNLFFVFDNSNQSLPIYELSHEYDPETCSSSDEKTIIIDFYVCKEHPYKEFTTYEIYQDSINKLIDPKTGIIYSCSDINAKYYKSSVRFLTDDSLELNKHHNLELRNIRQYELQSYEIYLLEINRSEDIVRYYLNYPCYPSNSSSSSDSSESSVSNKREVITLFSYLSMLKETFTTLKKDENDEKDFSVLHSENNLLTYDVNEVNQTVLFTKFIYDMKTQQKHLIEDITGKKTLVR